MESAMIDTVEEQIVDLLGCGKEDILHISARTGQGVPELLQAIIERVPAPEGDPDAPLQALIFDSVFNSFRGIIGYFRVMNGSIKQGDKVKFFNTGKVYEADEVGILKIKMMPRQEVYTGDVGYIISGIKTVSRLRWAIPLPR